MQVGPFGAHLQRSSTAQMHIRSRVIKGSIRMVHPKGARTNEGNLRHEF